jgi:diguanylate cyclase (GGDEF)-like protein
MELLEKYYPILQDYLAQQSETALYQASLFGRKLMERGIGPEEIVELHGQALQKILAQTQPVKIPGRTLESFNLLLELIMAYSLAYQEYMAHKSREMDSLELYTKKLEAANNALQQKVSDLNTINEFASAFSSALRLKDTAKLIVTKLSEVIPYKSSALYLCQPGNGRLKKLATTGTEHLIRLGIDQNSKEIHWRRQHGILTIPLWMDNKPLAYLLLTPTAGKACEELWDLLAIIAKQAAFALARALMHEEIWLQSITDSKTGLYNLHYFQRECEKALAQNKKLTLLMLDLDDFKSFNDRFGHLKGDEALASLGKLLKETIRKKDFAARYGGEEFLLALFDLDSSQAQKVAERIRKSMSQLDLNVSEELTISIGIAAAPKGDATFEQLLAQADRALYLAKDQGKNRVCCAIERLE